MAFFILEIMAGFTGAFLFVWSLSLRRLSKAQRPRFVRSAWFRRGIPLAGTALVTSGFLLAVRQNIWLGGMMVIVCFVVSTLLVRYDQYSAMTRVLYSDYLNLKKENPQATEYDLLYSIVKSRKPRWSEDRIVEVCAGKDIRQLVLLLLVLEFEIHPLHDMHLYEHLKGRVEELYPAQEHRCQAGMT